HNTPLPRERAQPTSYMRLLGRTLTGPRHAQKRRFAPARGSTEDAQQRRRECRAEQECDRHESWRLDQLLCHRVGVRGLGKDSGIPGRHLNWFMSLSLRNRGLELLLRRAWG